MHTNLDIYVSMTTKVFHEIYILQKETVVGSHTNFWRFFNPFRSLKPPLKENAGRVRPAIPLSFRTLKLVRDENFPMSTLVGVLLEKNRKIC